MISGQGACRKHIPMLVSNLPFDLDGHWGPPPVPERRRIHERRNVEALEWRFGIQARRRNADASLTPMIHRYPDVDTSASTAAEDPRITWARNAAEEDGFVPRHARQQQQQNRGQAEPEQENNIPEGLECMYCFTRPRSVMTLPCGHCGLCTWCWYEEAQGPRQFTCPVCNVHDGINKAERLNHEQLQQISDGAQLHYGGGTEGPLLRLT